MAQLIFELDSNGVALVCTSQPIDTSEENPAGRLTMHILIAMADFERSLIKGAHARWTEGGPGQRRPSWSSRNPRRSCGEGCHIALARALCTCDWQELRLPASSVFKALKLAKAA